MNTFRYSQTGLQLTEHFEADGGPVLTAYWDSTGKKWTIGFGHTGSDVHEGLVWTPQQCQTALENDIAWAERIVNRYATDNLNQSQFDALVDFTFNVGATAFINSSLLRYVNASNMPAAKLEFGKWVRSGGKILNGLVARRHAEETLFTNAS